MVDTFSQPFGNLKRNGLQHMRAQIIAAVLPFIRKVANAMPRRNNQETNIIHYAALNRF
ncbi:hypothetical protein D3C72_2336440 [compost metagenome]